MPDKRIATELPLPSISLKRFIERALADDEFFDLALESPIAAMNDCGVNLDTRQLVPADLATFLGALAGLREVVKEQGLKDLSFERVFGRPAIIRGALLEAEVARGFFREFDQQAVTHRAQFVSTEQKFETVRERIGNSLRQLLRDRLSDTRVERLSEIYRDVVSRQFESSETWNHTDKDWDKQESQSNRGSSRGVDKNFDREGVASLADLLRGPLINPVDLAALSARIQAHTQALKSV